MGARIAAIACVLLAAAPARAELTAVELEARGEALAKNGRYGEAIEAFKAADQIRPLASHACLIALAYARRELWFQAEIWNATCHERAKPDDPVPEWGAELQVQIEGHYRDAGVVPVTIAIEPALPGARVELADFPGAAFVPRTLHLPKGHYEAVLRLPGHDGRRAFDVAGEHDLLVTVYAIPLHHEDPTRRRLLIAGGVTLGLGVASYGVMGASWLKLRHDPDFNNGISTTTETIYKTSRATTIGFGVLGAALVIAGFAWHGDTETPAVSAVPLPGGGGMLAIGWSR